MKTTNMRNVAETPAAGEIHLPPVQYTVMPFKGMRPDLDPSVFLADGARIVGDVKMEKDCSVWFNTVVRGDVNYIRVGERTNIQDNAVIHVTHKKFPCIIGANVTVGHSAVIHAATIYDYCLIGMGAVVLDDAKVGPFALVAAGAVVLGGTVIPEGTLAAGIPAKVMRKLTDEERAMLIQSAQNYVDYVAAFRGQS
jgi:gamma-carbonic anhydrase